MTSTGLAEERTTAPGRPAVRPSRRARLFITWYPYCRRSDALASKLSARSYLVHYLRFKTPLQAPVKYVMQSLKTIRILFRERPAIVLVASPPVVAPLVVWAGSLLLGYRFVIDAHSGVFQHRLWRWSLPLHRFLARKALATIVTSDHLASVVGNWGGRAMKVQDLTLELHPFGEASRSDRFHVIFICTYSVDEPMQAVVDAARILPEVIFTFTGDPSYAPRGFHVGLPANVRLNGFVPDADYLALLRGANAILVLTKDDHTMQRGGYEAVALEKPLIISDWPLLREVFSRGAVHVDNSPEAIAEAIRAVRLDPAFWGEEMKKLKKEREAISTSQVAAVRRLFEEIDGGEGMP